MAITTCVPKSVLEEVAKATHDLESDTLKVALFDDNATLDEDTTAYSTTNEITGSGYTAGGKTLALQSGAPKDVGKTRLFTFDAVTWSSLTASDIRGCMIYNASKSDKVLAVVDFKQTYDRSGANLTLTFPDIDLGKAMIRFTRRG